MECLYRGHFVPLHTQQIAQVTRVIPIKNIEISTAHLNDRYRKLTYDAQLDICS